VATGCRSPVSERPGLYNNGSDWHWGVSGSNTDRHRLHLLNNSWLFLVLTDIMLSSSRSQLFLLHHFQYIIRCLPISDVISTHSRSYRLHTLSFIKSSGHNLYHQFKTQQFHVLPTQCI